MLHPRKLSLRKQNAIRRSLMLFKQQLKDLSGRRNTFGDQIRVRDEILFYHGTPEDVKAGNAKLFIVTKGHIVNLGLMDLQHFLSANSMSDGSSTYGGPSTDWASKTSSYMRVGTGGSVTTGATTTLTAQQNTAPDGQSGSNATPSGTYRISWMATWNAGTLPAITVTEVGLFLNLKGSAQAFGATYGHGDTPMLFSRLSEADGDFSSFAINTAVPLTIEWRLLFEFV